MHRTTEKEAFGAETESPKIFLIPPKDFLLKFQTIIFLRKYKTELMAFLAKN